MKTKLSCVLSAVAMLIAATGSPAPAQTRPMPDSATRPNTRWQAPSGYVPPRDYGMAEPFRPGEYVPPPPPAVMPSVNDYPAAEVQAVPGAQARYAMARAEFRAAQNMLYATMKRLEDSFENSSDMRNARKDEQDAYNAYVQVRHEATRPLMSDSYYQSLTSLRIDLSQKLDDLRDSEKPEPRQVEALARAKMNYSSQAHAMEQERFVGDTRVQDARQRLHLAAGRVADLRADFRRDLLNRPEVASARKSVEDARIAEITSEAFLDGAVRAREKAMDYAYTLHQYDRYRNLHYDYAYPAYGYGYGSYRY